MSEGLQSQASSKPHIHPWCLSSSLLFLTFKSSLSLPGASPSQPAAPAPSANLSGPGLGWGSSGGAAGQGQGGHSA